MDIKAGLAGRSVNFGAWTTATGAPVTVTPATTGLSLWYRRGVVGAKVAISPVAFDPVALTTAWTSGGILVIEGAEHRLDLPDAAIAAEAGVLTVSWGGTATGITIDGGTANLIGQANTATDVLHWLGTAAHAATVAGVPVVQLHASDAGGGINAPANFEDLSVDSTGLVAVPTTQKVDVETIKAKAVAVDTGGTTFPATVASSTEVTSIQNNTRCVRVVPAVIERPDTGTQTYRIELLLYDAVGNMEAPDSAPTIALVNQAGTDLSARLDSATMALVSAGRYRAIYTATSTDAMDQLVWAFSVIEGGVTRIYGNTSLIVDTTAVDFTAADRTALGAVQTRVELSLPAVAPNADGGLVILEHVDGILTIPACLKAVNATSIAGTGSLVAAAWLAQYNVASPVFTNQSVNQTGNCYSSAQRQQMAREAYGVSGTVRHVALAVNGGNDANDGLSWATAKLSPKTVIEAASAGDLVLLDGHFDLGAAYIARPDGVSVRGRGIGLSSLTSSNDSYSVLSLASDSEVCDLACISTGYVGMGLRSGTGAINVILRRVYSYGLWDGVVLGPTYASDLQAWDTTFESEYDALSSASEYNEIDLYNCHVRGTGPSTSGPTAGLAIYEGTLRMHGGTIDARDGIAYTRDVLLGYNGSSVANVDLFDVTIKTQAPTGSQRSVDNRGAGVARLIGCDYDQTTVSNTGGGEVIDISIAVVIQKLIEADRTIDTTTTPWQLVYKEKGTVTELLRQDIKDTAGADMTATTQVIGQLTLTP